MMLTMVEKTIQTHQMINPGEKVVLGLSGGCDSVALLHALLAMQSQFDFKLYAVHINHKLRGTDSEKDMQFVSSLCELYNIPSAIYTYDIENESCRRGKSVEEWGRHRRYEAYEKAAVKFGAEKVALAHHKDDSAETILMNLMRGSGPKGLAGIPPVRGHFIRPLIGCRRKEIEKYILDHAFPYTVDHTNREEIYTRNRVRLQLIPFMEELSGKDIVESITRAGTIIDEENKWMESIASDALTTAMADKKEGSLALSVSVLAPMPAPLTRRVIRLALAELWIALPNITYKHIEDIIALIGKETGKEIQISNQISVKKQYDKLIMEKKLNAPRAFCYPLALNQPFWIPEAGLWVTIYKGSEIQQKNEDKNYTFAVDYDKIKGTIFVRSRQNGDRIQLDENHSKKIKDFLMDKKIPRENRSKIPIICDENKIICIGGLRVSHQYYVTDCTKEKLYIVLKEGCTS